MKKWLTCLLALVLVMLLAGTACASGGSLALQDRGSEVKSLQKSLLALGYNPGKADGIFGEQTDAAVRAFQKDNGLQVDGVAGKSTLKAIENAQSAANSQTSKPEKTQSAESTNLFNGNYVYLEHGSTRNEVRVLQKALIELGYDVKKNGRFDDKTQEAVKAFQKAQGLHVDGVAGPDTEKKLESAIAKARNESEEQQLKAQMPSAKLKKGDKGDDVTTLQKRLVELGYFNKKEISGIYDDATVHGVTLFQKQHKLSDDGIAGTTTLKLLFSTKAEMKN